MRVAAKWSGPMIALGGAIFLVLILALQPPDQNRVSAWLLWSALSISTALPLAGLGGALSMSSAILASAGLAGLLAGELIGFQIFQSVAPWFTSRSGVSQHLYLTVPLSGLAAGLLLIAPEGLRRWLVLPVGLTVGFTHATTTMLTDPTLHDPAIPRLGLFIGLWLPLSVMLSLRALRRPWLPVPMRILGSWLLASGLLHGSAALAAKPPPLTLHETPARAHADKPPEDLDSLFPQFAPSEDAPTAE